jgi:predicted neutral ceramidase superfamily lipid hydrolase
LANALAHVITSFIGIDWIILEYLPRHKEETMKKVFYLTWMILLSLCLALAWLMHSQTLTHFNITAGGSLVIALITLFSFWVAVSKMEHKNPHKFVNGMLLSTTMKFLLFMAAAAIFLVVQGKSLHKPDLFFLMGVYLIFLIMEALILSKFARRMPTSH